MEAVSTRVVNCAANPASDILALARLRLAQRVNLYLRSSATWFVVLKVTGKVCFRHDNHGPTLQVVPPHLTLAVLAVTPPRLSQTHAAGRRLQN